MERTWLQVLVAVILLGLVYSQECRGWSEERRCRNGIECYQGYERCGGTSECSDDTDELGCTVADCPWERASKIKYCHSTQRCINTWNEDCLCNPGCRSGETCCSDGSGCFNEDQRCDEVNHCVNGNDEKECWKYSSTSTSVVLVAGIIGSVVLLVIVIVVIIVLIRCSRMRRTPGVVMQPVVTGHYPQEIQQQHPQQYQQQQTSVYVPQQASAPLYSAGSDQGAPPPSYDAATSK